MEGVIVQASVIKPVKGKGKWEIIRVGLKGIACQKLIHGKATLSTLFFVATSFKNEVRFRFTQCRGATSIY